MRPAASWWHVLLCRPHRLQPGRQAAEVQYSRYTQSHSTQQEEPTEGEQATLAHLHEVQKEELEELQWALHAACAPVSEYVA
jgi:hypothetical protein